MNWPEVTYAMHLSADRSTAFSKCYFIGGDRGLIKIGHSIDPVTRLADIQACSPIRLRILALRAGGADREAAYHQEFFDFREHGEWFRREPRLMREIKRLQALPPPAMLTKVIR
jgi:hypothetical protein